MAADFPLLSVGVAGAPASDSIRVLTNFVIDFDTRLRNPKWVVEHFTDEKLQGDGNRCDGVPGLRCWLDTSRSVRPADHPRFAAYLLTQPLFVHCSSLCRTNSSFYEDQGLDPRFRSKLSDYRGSGYDRGHLAPAANHKASQETMNETFMLSNTCPQVGSGFNRDMWARLERFVYELRDSCTDVFVVSGPLYLPQRRGPGERFMMNHEMIGERG